MQRHDRAALTQALALCRNEGVGRAWQIDAAGSHFNHQSSAAHAL